MKTLAPLLLFTGGFIHAQILTPVWIQLGDHGQILARTIVTSASACPSLTLDGVSTPMLPRTPVPPGFPPACELAIPAHAKTAVWDSKPLPLPHAAPAKILVFGDTGCRVKGDRIQACDDPAQWPLPAVAQQAAAESPDLIIHVGDYVYRESACPPAQKTVCGTVPPGDHWEAWNADFFTPAAPLLAAAPWVFVRGNHEDCDRSWRGWFYYLDPHPFNGAACEAFPPPYTVTLGSFQLVVLDSSGADGKNVKPKQVALYARQLAALHVTNAWLADHHPFYLEPLTSAWKQAHPTGFSWIVSGHKHQWDLQPPTDGRPSQLTAGNGGTTLISGSFGYTVFEKKDNTWTPTPKSITK